MNAFQSDLAETVYKYVQIKTIPPGGKYPDEFIDVKISEITPMHDVPRATVPKGVEDAEKLLRKDGFKVAEPTLVNPVKVLELPDGTKIIMDGHHRVKAMQNLQEAHVPVNYKTYDDLVASVNSGASAELLADVYYLLTIGKKTGKYKGSWFPDHPSLTSIRKQELINNADDFIRKDFPDLATGLSQAQFTELLTSVKSKLDNFVFESWFDNIGEGLLKKLDELSDDVIAKLGKDLEVQDFAKAIKENGDLVDAWASVKFLKNKAGDIDFLSWNKTFQDWTRGNGKKLYEHIFNGKTGGTNGISGAHHVGALTTKTSGFNVGDIRMISGTKVSKSDRFYEAEIEFWDGAKWITKTENGVPVKNGFFPDNWTHAQIMEEVAFVRSKVSIGDIPPKTSSNAFVRPISNG